MTALVEPAAGLAGLLSANIAMDLPPEGNGRSVDARDVPAVQEPCCGS